MRRDRSASFSKAEGIWESTMPWALALRILSRMSVVRPLYTPSTTTSAPTPKATPRMDMTEMTYMKVCLRREKR